MNEDEAGSREAIALARLCSGAPAPRIGELGPHDWAALLDRAERERCVGLGWLRGAAVIRGVAPPEVAAAWRARALRLGMTAREQLVQLAALLSTFEESGVQATVLKGFPLAQRLHGDAYVRPLADVDLYVPLAQRQAAHDALLVAGFSHRSGEAPHEGIYHRASGPNVLFVEVHSAVLDEVLLSHLQLPAPEAKLVDVDGVRMYAPDGPLLPVFLAGHLAKHSGVPLLWWIDFATLWTRLTEADRRASSAAASAHGAARHLAWATQGVEHLTRMIEGTPAQALTAAAALGALHERHVALRVIALASSLGERVESFLAWLWPHQLRRSPWRYLGHLAIRFAQLARKLRRTPRPAGPPLKVDERALSVGDGELLELARTVLGTGAAMWIRARGRSMGPTIPDGAMVLVAPIDRPLGRGDVVLAAFPDGKAVIHRVHRVAGASVVLQGDAMVAPDRPVDRAAVVGRVELVRLYDHARPPRQPLVQAARMAVVRMRRTLARRIPSASMP
ncbi:MAG TPA: nucleotidyltransferase family protein [Gemmatimonadaceae bacterium]|nr:nucleotidyltransferase family protein [Gemmatimonadaceae bacterium]